MTKNFSILVAITTVNTALPTNSAPAGAFYAEVRDANGNVLGQADSPSPTISVSGVPLEYDTVYQVAFSRKDLNGAVIPGSEVIEPINVPAPVVDAPVVFYAAPQSATISVTAE